MISMQIKPSIYIYIRGAYDKFPDFFRMAFKIVIDSWKFTMLLLYIYFFDFRFKWTATAAIGIHPTKAWLSQLVHFKNAIWHFRRTICNKIVLNLEKMPEKRMECIRLLFNHLAWIEHQVLSGIRDSRKAQSLCGMMRGVGGVRKSIHQSWLAKGLGLLSWGFKGVQEEIPWKEASTLQIGSVAFQPDNTPVDNSILVTDYLTKMGIKTFPHPPYSPQEDFDEAFQKLLEQYKKCITAGGDYFEVD